MGALGLDFSVVQQLSKNEPIRKLVQYIRVFVFTISTPQIACEKTDTIKLRATSLDDTVQKVALVNSTLPSFYEVCYNWTKEYWSFLRIDDRLSCIHHLNTCCVHFYWKILLFHLYEGFFEGQPYVWLSVHHLLLLTG